jgi:hypothetical protein
VHKAQGQRVEILGQVFVRALRKEMLQYALDTSNRGYVQCHSSGHYPKYGVNPVGME